MNLKQSLHSLLSDNQTAEVIKQVRSLTENKLTGLHNELEQISALFEQNEEESRLEFADETTTHKNNAKAICDECCYNSANTFLQQLYYVRSFALCYTPTRLHYF